MNLKLKLFVLFSDNGKPFQLRVNYRKLGAFHFVEHVSERSISYNVVQFVLCLSSWSNWADYTYLFLY